MDTRVRQGSAAPVSSDVEDTYARRVASMVLAGWTLLDEFCPVHGAVPLVMDTRGRKYSVAQEAYVSSNSDHANEERHVTWTHSDDAHVQLRQQQAPSTLLSSSSSPSPQGLNHGVGTRRRSPETAATAHAVSGPGSGSGFGSAGGNVPRILLPEVSGNANDEVVDPYAVLQATQRTLWGKIEAANACLAAQDAPNSGGGGDTRSTAKSATRVGQSQQLVALIHECSQALLALRQVAGEE